jgi:hypothetical protein
MDCSTYHLTVSTAVSQTTYGPIYQAEGGKANRHADGRLTQSTLEQRFNQVPHVQITPNVGPDPFLESKQF